MLAIWAEDEGKVQIQEKGEMGNACGPACECSGNCGLRCGHDWAAELEWR